MFFFAKLSLYIKAVNAIFIYHTQTNKYMGTSNNSNIIGVSLKKAPDYKFSNRGQGYGINIQLYNNTISTNYRNNEWLSLRDNNNFKFQVILTFDNNFILKHNKKCVVWDNEHYLFAMKKCYNYIPDKFKLYFKSQKIPSFTNIINDSSDEDSMAFIEKLESMAAKEQMGSNNYRNHKFLIEEDLTSEDLKMLDDNDNDQRKLKKKY